MADVYIMVDPRITIGGVELVCHGNSLALTPEDTLTEVATFCNPGGLQPGSTTWTLTVGLLQSFGADGAWNQLQAMRKTKQTVVVQPTSTDGNVPAPDNPTATFEIWVPSVPFVDGEISEATEFELEATSIGEPVFAVA